MLLLYLDILACVLVVEVKPTRIAAMVLLCGPDVSYAVSILATLIVIW